MILYMLFRKPIFSLVALLPVAIISWQKGRVAGCMAAIIDSFFTNLIIFIFDSQIYSFFILEPIMGLCVQLIFAFTIGTIGSMAKNLQLEIIERKKVEKQLKDYQNQLEGIVQERTEQLQATNERLRQIEKMEAVGQLAGGIAHDFNNQLSIVLGYCELLNRYLSDNPKLRNYLEQIQSSGQRAADLTKQLLAFARKGVYKLEVIDIHKIITEVVTLLSHSINKNITIEHTLNAKRPLIWGGANQIQNTILNLALNARDAMPDGGRLTFATSDIEIDDEFIMEHTFDIYPGPYISLMISDTGIGMNSELMKHIFEPFFTTKEQGTGMGLAAVFGIVNSHKGEIEVQSKIGSGSTFTLYFPVTSKTRTSETMPGLLFNENRKLHIFIIDDEKQVARTIKELISAPGITVTLAYCGNEAVQIYSQRWKEIDIVILDMIMPDLNGRQTYLALKEINPAIKTIVTSGFTMNQEIDLTLSAGASAFLQKPYNRSELFNFIDTVLSKSSQCN